MTSTELDVKYIAGSQVALSNGVNICLIDIDQVRLVAQIQNPKTGRAILVNFSNGKVRCDIYLTGALNWQQCRSQYYSSRCDHIRLVKEIYPLWFEGKYQEIITARQRAEIEANGQRALAQRRLLDRERKQARVEILLVITARIQRLRREEYFRNRENGQRVIRDLDVQIPDRMFVGTRTVRSIHLP